MDDDEIGSLVVRAGKIADAAPSPLRSSAFEVVLRFLLGEGEEPSVKGRRPRKRAAAKKAPRPAAQRTGTASAAKPAKRSSKAASPKPAKRGIGGRRPGPKAAVEGLIDSDFLATPRTNKAIREELRHSKGWTYDATDLSPTLVRMLRDGVLTRDKNADGQYEFRAP